MYLASMSMETTGGQVGNLGSWNSDNLYYFFNQLQSLATCKLLVSLGSGSV